jgi:hypothetical protein
VQLVQLVRMVRRGKQHQQNTTPKHNTNQWLIDLGVARGPMERVLTTFGSGRRVVSKREDGVQTVVLNMGATCYWQPSGDAGEGEEGQGENHPGVLKQPGNMLEQALDAGLARKLSLPKTERPRAEGGGPRRHVSKTRSRLTDLQVTALTKWLQVALAQSHSFRKSGGCRNRATIRAQVGEQGPQLFPVHVKQGSSWQEDKHDGRLDRCWDQPDSTAAGGTGTVTLNEVARAAARSSCG